MQQFRLILSRLLKARSGVVAVEFALIAPVLILLFFATIELAQLIDCRTRVIDATASVADLIAQNDSVTTTGLSAMDSTVESIIYPYDTDNRIKMVVSSFELCDADDSSGNCAKQNSDHITLDWSWASGTGATERTSVPSDLSADVFTSTGAGLVMVEVTYTYSPATVQFLDGDYTLSWTAYSIPRLITAVTKSD